MFYCNNQCINSGDERCQNYKNHNPQKKLKRENKLPKLTTGIIFPFGAEE
jgi:hypothetical protein